MKDFALRALAAVGLCALPGAALASPVTIYYQQEVTAVTADGLGRFADAGIGPGTTLTGSLTYDPAATNLSDETFFYDEWSLVGMTLDLPSGTIDLTDPRVRATDFDPGNPVNPDGWRATGNGPEGLSASIALQGLFAYQSGTTQPNSTFVGTGDGRPFIAPPEPNLVISARSDLRYFSDGRGGLATGDVTLSDTPFPTPTPAQVPLPAGLPLLLGGIAVLAGLRHRARRDAA
jgi:hypothetical protein